MSGSATPEAIMTPERSVREPEFRIEEIQGWFFGTVSTPTQLILTGGCDTEEQALRSMRNRTEKLMMGMERKDELHGTDHGADLGELEGLVWDIDMRLDALAPRAAATVVEQPLSVS